MDFEYTTTIHISLEDLRKMYLYVKKGGDFCDIFDDIISGYDDKVYYSSEYIFDQVQDEILRRLKQSEKNK